MGGRKLRYVTRDECLTAARVLGCMLHGEHDTDKAAQLGELIVELTRAAATAPSNYDVQLYDELRTLAVGLHGCDEVEFDKLREQDISWSDEGVWVRGWLWVSREEMHDAGINEDA